MDGLEFDRRAAEADLAGGRRLDAGEDGNQRRFAGAVLAENDVDLAGPKVEIDPVERENAGKLLADPGRLKQRGGRRRVAPH